MTNTEYNVYVMEATEEHHSLQMIASEDHPSLTMRARTFFNKEPETIAWIDRWEIPNGVFFDVGPNVGVYSLYASTIHESLDVYAFEPMKINFEYLNKHVSLNKLHNIRTFNVGLSNFSKMSTFCVIDGDAGTSGGQISLKGRNASEIIIFSIDDLIEKFDFPTPNYVKIDVDGVECDILRGMEKTLVNEDLKGLLVEFDGQDDRDTWVSYLATCGLVVDDSYDAMPNHSSTRRVNHPALANIVNVIFKRL